MIELDSGMRGMTPAAFLAAAQQAAERFPNSVLVRNGVGNLSVIAGRQFVGWIDLLTGEVNEVNHEEEQG